MPFLTVIDSRAAIKGSRDPLGAQAIWTLLGRHVAGGLTTNTTSVRDFVVLLLGYRFIEKPDEAGSREETLLVFIRWARLASYARLQTENPRVRRMKRTGGPSEDQLPITLPHQLAGMTRASRVETGHAVFGRSVLRQEG